MLLLVVVLKRNTNTRCDLTCVKPHEALRNLPPNLSRSRPSALYFVWSSNWQNWWRDNCTKERTPQIQTLHERLFGFTRAFNLKSKFATHSWHRGLNSRTSTSLINPQHCNLNHYCYSTEGARVFTTHKNNIPQPERRPRSPITLSTTDENRYTRGGRSRYSTFLNFDLYMTRLARWLSTGPTLASIA